jgi:hypothetical protein
MRSFEIATAEGDLIPVLCYDFCYILHYNKTLLPRVE